MKPIVINITNLIGTMVIIGDKNLASNEIQESISEALLRVIAKAQNLESPELHQDKTSLQSKDLENQD
jgi:hypothetical protein